MLKFTFKKDLRRFKTDEEIVFDKPNTILVCDNGSDKSTLMQLSYRDSVGYSGESNYFHKLKNEIVIKERNVKDFDHRMKKFVVSRMDMGQMADIMYVDITYDNNTHSHDGICLSWALALLLIDENETINTTTIKLPNMLLPIEYRIIDDVNNISDEKYNFYDVGSRGYVVRI